jgi:hypothetical protein
MDDTEWTNLPNGFYNLNISLSEKDSLLLPIAGFTLNGHCFYFFNPAFFNRKETEGAKANYCFAHFVSLQFIYHPCFAANVPSVTV